MIKNKSNLYLITIITIVLLFLSSCSGSTDDTDSLCSTCNDPGKWSECGDDAIKTRTNFMCNEETNNTCQEYIEEKNCMTEIQLEGSKELNTLISPTLDEKIKEIITIEATSVPENTDELTVILVPMGVDLGPDMSEEDVGRLIQQIDSNGADGWKVFIDTNTGENGIYSLFIGATYDGASGESPWLDHASTQVIVNN